MPRDLRIAYPFSPPGRGPSSSNLKIAPVPKVTRSHNFSFEFCVSTMPCKDGEEAMNARDTQPPCTPQRPTGNGGADHSESDGQMNSENDSDEDLKASKKKRKYRGSREYTLMKRWVTGDKAEMDLEDIERETRELFELARDWMSQSESFQAFAELFPQRYIGWLCLMAGKLLK
jgi:hypothetical protein